MKKITMIVFLLTLMSCGNKENTSFYVKNTSTKEVNLYSVEIGPVDSYQSFKIKPNDSTVVASFSITEISPEKWIKEFDLKSSDSLKIEDSKNPKNWIKGIGKSREPIYTFNIVK